MRLALVADIHANLEAFESVLADIEQQDVDQVFSLGDVIGYGCDPLACLDLVERHCSVRLMGNHEYVALGRSPLDNLNASARESILWTRSQLTDQSRQLIASFQMQHALEDVLFVHASPHEPEHWNYLLSAADAEPAFASTDARIVFFGHTHLPCIFSQGASGAIKSKVGHSFEPDIDGRYFVNVGSVGQPRDNDNRACYVVFDMDAGEVTYRRVAYDIERTQEKLIDARMPRLLVDRLVAGR